MPRYFFHVRGGEPAVDAEGLEFLSRSDAEREAIAATGEMLRDAANTTSHLADWKMEVTDDSGSVLFTLSVSARSH